MNKLRNKSKLLVLGLFMLSLFWVHFAHASVSQSDLNKNGIPDSTESSVVVVESSFLDAGEYQFNNLIIPSWTTLILKGDPGSSNSFKGVKILADNITIEENAYMSADAQGYSVGPGASPQINIGASYGGVGGNNASGTTYGSSLAPKDLGSGVSGNYRGGGAIWLEINGTLSHNGGISADGINYSSSGGSVYIVTNNLSGSGDIRANGGGISWPDSFTGGGGRVAVYYNNSSFAGKTEARAGNYCFYGCAPNGGSGTAGLFNMSNNTLTVTSQWHFQVSDGPFNFNHLVFKNKAKITSDNNVSITAQDMLVDNSSTLTLAEGQILNISQVTISNYSTLKLSENKTLKINNLNVLNISLVTVEPEKVLSLKISNLNIDTDSTVSVDGKGYEAGPGAPPVFYEGGASYGGKGGGNSAPAYGSADKPIDFGSGTEGRRGGGAIRLDISGTLHNDGFVSALGSYDRTSGGSIYVTVGNLSGSGAFRADGFRGSWPNGSAGGGAGGRIALYFNNSDYVPTATARGGVYCFYGCAPAAEDGTVVINSAGAVCLVDCFSNVLFLPGFKASRLYLNENGNENQLWEPNRNLDVEKLYLDANGDSLRPDIYTKDIINETNTPFSTGSAGQNIYKSFSKLMGELMDEFKITAWEPYAYDWRQSVDDIVNNGTNYANGSKSLVSVLEGLIASSKSGKVTIVAHSNGGLLAKALLKKLQNDKNSGVNDLIDKIDVLIMVAAPQIGTAQAVPAMLHGYKQKFAGGLLMDEIRARELGRNMPGAYGLLPSREYINRVSASPVTFLDTVIPSGVTTSMVQTFGSAIDSYSEYKNFLFGGEGRINPSSNQTKLPIILSQNLFSKAESLHDGIDTWTPPVSLRVIEVAGWGLDTVASFEYYPKCISSSTLGCNFILDERPRFTSDGDGTVVVPSAQYISFLGSAERYWIDLPRYNRFFNFTVDRNHKDILEVDSVNDLVKLILQKESIVINDVLKNTQPVDVSNRLRLSIHSPVTIDAYDADGNHTGKVCSPTSDFCFVEENILNSSYLEFGEGKYLNLPADKAKSIKLQGIDVGTFTYESEKVLPNGSSSTTTFKNIPVTQQTKAEVAQNTNGVLELRLDKDGDGTLDTIIKAKEGETVTMPYVFSGFLPPLANKDVFKAGSTIPIKLQLKDFEGNIVQAKELPVWLSPKRGTKMGESISESVPDVVATLGNTYRWDEASQQYIYNWSTKGLTKGYWYEIYVKLDDGNTYSVVVGLK